MIREDDFAKRRVEKGIADLTDEQLYDKFWEMCSKVVDPLLELGTKNTTPSIEKTILLRIGVSSLDTQKIIEGAIYAGNSGFCKG